MVVSASAQTTGPPRFENLLNEFNYDRATPLNVRELSRQRKGKATLIDLTFASPKGGVVPAYLLVPAGKGPFPAVIFGHWMMNGSPFANRNEFLEEAIVLAQSGVVSLLTDAPMVRPGYIREKDEERLAVQQCEAARQHLIDFRRGVDLLLARNDVDGKRIAFVGHSFDAHVGAILSGVEKRIQSFVLMAGGYADEEYVFDPDKPEMLKARERIGDERLRAYFRNYAWDDPVHFLGHSTPAAVFLQYGKQDKPITAKMAEHAYERFGEPKRMAFYEAGHALNALARRDRARWLGRRLSVEAIDLEALARIPELK
jgi:dienelactone hydrolase